MAGLVLTDVAMVLAAVVVSGSGGVVDAYVYAGSVLLVLALSGAHRVRLDLQALDDVPRLAYALVLSVLPFLGALGVRQATGGAFVRQLVLTGVALLLGRAVTYAVIRGLRRRGRCCEATAIVGSGAVGMELAGVLRDHPEYGLVPVGFVDSVRPPVGSTPALPLLGRVEDLVDILRRLDLHEVIVAFGPMREANWIGVLRTAIVTDVRVHIVPRFFDIGLSRSGHDDEVWGIPLYRVRRTALRTATWRAKRLIDVVVAGAALLAIAPVMAAIAVAVQRSSPGPVLFRQLRLGQDGREFEMLKFRTLRQEHSSNTSNQLTGMTPVGRWLRRLSLDELPQFWNVLRGDMSLIGPRPERPYFVKRYSDEVPGYGDRHRLPGGLTGWAQIHGLRGDTSIRHRARFDNAYIEGWSPWFDVVILVRTLAAVLRDALRPPGGARRGPGRRQRVAEPMPLHHPVAPGDDASHAVDDAETAASAGRG